MDKDTQLVGVKTVLPEDKKKEIDSVKSVIRDTLVDFHNYIFPKYIKNYKDYLGFVAERMAALDPWQSNVNYPMISSTVDTMFGNIFDFGYEFGIKELGLKNLCTKSFDFRGQGRKVFKDVTKEILICGKGYVKDYFIKEDFKDKFFDREIMQEIKVPSLMYLSIFDVMYDRSKGLENSSYKIIRTFSTGNAIKKKILPLLVEQTGKTKKEVEKILDSWLKKYKNEFGHRFSMYDYNPVKSLLATQQWFDSLKNNKTFFELPNALKYNDLLSGYMNTQNGVREDAKNYFLNDSESSFELVEYTTDDRRYIFVNGNIVYFGNKMTNIGEIREAVYNSIPGTGNAMGAADKQGSLQAIQNTLWNAFIDNIKLNLGPMFRISGNIPQGKNGTLDFKAFRTIKTQGQNDIEKIQLGVSDFAPMNFMQMVETASQKDFAMTNYVMGGGGAIERTQGGIDLKFNQYKSRLTPITDSIDQMMANIARSWIFMYLKFFTKKELSKLGVTVEDKFIIDENGNDKFETILLNKVDIRDIIDETNITFSYNSLDKVTKEATRDTITRNLQYLLQYAGGQLNMQEVGKILAGLDFNPIKLFIDKQASESSQNKIEEQPIVEGNEQSSEETSDEDLLQQLSNIV